MTACTCLPCRHALMIDRSHRKTEIQGRKSDRAWFLQRLVQHTNRPLAGPPPLTMASSSMSSLFSMRTFNKISRVGLTRFPPDMSRWPELNSPRQLDFEAQSPRRVTLFSSGSVAPSCTICNVQYSGQVSRKLMGRENICGLRK